MKLVIWLWNPWDKYKNTRHNLGFLFLEYLKEKQNLEEFKFESKFKAETSLMKLWNNKVILLKPQTFMNLSWESVREISHFYKIIPEDIIVIYDDMSMEFWKIRIRDKWSAGGHNWVKNIIKYFWNDWKRIKVWVWFNQKYDVSDRVLSKFSEEELIDLKNEIFPKCHNILKEEI